MIILYIQLAIYALSIFIFFRFASKYYAYRSSTATVGSHNIGGGIATLIFELKWRFLFFWEKFRVFLLFIAIAYLISILFGDFWIRILAFAFSAYAFVVNNDAYDLFSIFGYEKNTDKLRIIERYINLHYKDGCFENYDISLKRDKGAFNLYIKIGEYSVATAQAKSNLEKLANEACGLAGLKVNLVIITAHR